jgi:hypothetical protein
MRTALTVVAAMVFPVVLVGGGSTGVGAAPPPVVVNELHYNPADGNPDSEFIELLNTTGSAIDLTGWCIDGIGYCFPGGASIPADGFLVRFGSSYAGALSNGGEEIVLLDRNGAAVDAVEYDDHGSWPAFADGEGQSLQRRDPAAPSDHAGNWVSGPPTPGAPNAGRGSGLLPTFDDVEHTVLPGAGAPVEVTAELDGATGAELVYRIGFGNEATVAMTTTGATVSATIPGQAAGALIRYRLQAARDGVTGTWPRQGDGARYDGTTVARSVGTDLPVFEFFMPDDDYRTMVADTTLSGDDGYPMVFAYEGQVFDNAKIRVKGQVSRTFPKKKFKIILAPGQQLSDDDRFPEDIDEWAMHSSWIDRSFLRETLASEFMDAAGAATQQAFPVRFERNGTFYGLYTYVEQPDGTWRDRHGLDDSEVYEVGPDNLFGLLLPQDATRSQDGLRARYDKETFEYLDDRRLRDFIATVNGLSGIREREWIYDHVDVASVVNHLAASMVIQNQDWGHKNYRLVFDQYGRIGIRLNDFDLTFGRRWSATAGPFDTRVYVGGAFEHPGGPFFETFFYDPELAQMVRRRVRTLAEELLEPNRLRQRVTELAATVRPEAVADRAVWGTYGGSADPGVEANRIVDSFVVPQHLRLLGAFAASGRVAATPQPASPAVVIESVSYDGIEHVVLRNRSGDTVDISGFGVTELDVLVAGGTVLLPGRAAVLVHEDVETTAGLFDGLIIAGTFGESLLDAPDGITLTNRTGDVVATWDLLPPGQLTELRGEPGRSALIGIAAVRSSGRGWLQVLPCDAAPGGTSNVNTDGPGQIRAALALTRLAADGTACIYNAMGTHEIADIQGYFAEGAIDDIEDQRLIDTRNGAAVPGRSIIRVTGGRPGATGIVNLTAVRTGPIGYLSVVPCSATADGEPSTSNLNWTTPNAVVAVAGFVEFDVDGAFCIYTHSETHVIADVQGYLADASFDDIADARLVDTRSGAMPAPGSSVRITGRPGATAVLSLVAIRPTARGFLRVHDCDDTAHTTSNLNYDRAGVVVAGLATARFDETGTACVYTDQSAHLVVDLQGYFEDGAFDDIDDVRVLDTR